MKILKYFINYELNVYWQNISTTVYNIVQNVSGTDNAKSNSF